MSARSGSDIREYYNEFSRNYERLRAGNDPGGYHDLVDDLEIDFAARYARDRELLEVGCGTGLLLERLARIARVASGVDLSPGMLEKARARGLRVSEGSATNLPFADASFDVTCSFKVLAHVPDIERALAEMVRVTRPGGHVIAEFYNPFSFRGLVKRFGPAGRIGQSRRESDVYTRFDPPWKIRRMLPPHVRIVGKRGIRIVTPAAVLMRVRLLGDALKIAERRLADSPLAHFGGFFLLAIEVGAGARGTAARGSGARGAAAPG